MKFRRGVMTSPAQAGLTNGDWAKQDKFNTKRADNSFNRNPVRTTKEVTGSFEFEGGTWTDLYNAAMILQWEDVSAVNGVETVTTRTATFTEVTTNCGAGFNNDSGEGSRKVSFEATTVTES